MEPAESAIDPTLDAVRQRRVSLRRAMSDLERALAAPAPSRMSQWDEGVRTAVRGLRTCMREHVQATEGPGGFHHDVVTVAPRLAHAVDVSTKEHVVITSMIDTLLADRAPTNEAGVDAVRDKGTELLALLSRHRQRGADMIFEAYESDLGGED
jgi:hypothetical protein